MGQGYGQEVCRRELPQGAKQALPLAKCLGAIGQVRPRRPKQRGHWMPAMGLVRRRRRVVAGNHQHIRLEVKQDRQGRVHTFDDLHLGVEVSILTPAVGVLDVAEDEIVPIPDFGDLAEFVLGAVMIPGRDHVHAH